MNLKKTILLLLSSLFLSGCIGIEPTAFMGSAITAGTNGNIYQAGLSYGTSKVIQKTTGKTTIEHITEFLDPKNEHQGDLVLIAKKHKQDVTLKIKKYKEDVTLKIKKNQEDTKLKIKKNRSNFFIMAKKNAKEIKLKIDNHKGDFISKMNNN